MKAILTYHSLDTSGSVISVAPVVFASHVRWLASGAVPVVPLSRIATLPADADAIALTFDDAFANFADVAAPLLMAAGLPATLFVVTENAGRTNAWRRGGDIGVPRLPLLGWDALGAMAWGGIEIGAHSRSHPHLTRLAADDDLRDELRDEVLGAGDEIATRLGVRPRSFAYPYGSVSEQVARIAAEGYAVACTTELAPVGRGDDPLQLPRLDAYYFRRPGVLESWGTPRFTGYLRARALARRARRTITTLRRTA